MTDARARHPMATNIRERLEESRTMEAYEQRPPYQRNDYLIWIDDAKTPETHKKRLEQMIHELKRGNVYMRMAWRA